jgi:hypothetical protein
MNFNWRQYISNYPDLKHFTKQREALSHYQTYGKSENRTDQHIAMIGNEPCNKSCVIVVAKYREDMSFTKNFKYPVKVYDKSTDYPNVGREAETYLRYIIENYDNLPDFVIFLQGNPFDHLPQNFDLFNMNLNNIRSAQPISNWLKLEKWNWATRTKQAFLTLFDENLPEYFQINRGAQYIVPKECITSRSLNFYQTIHKVLCEVDNKTEHRTNCLVCPWTLERMWPYIFNPSLKVKNFAPSDLI